ncbi:fructosamine kinase family protein [Piscinibacter sp.]|uniref:fructosamine kinase family protein n=1 Tax=Piscinibacter sp. TaxID=1903157 RepID=UPI002C2B66A2|nr:fructosamine kinase family protein [Albitalea sp.]HUG21333.1 fructosamine kinase family protein [Albitalea sp.]
MDAGSISDSLNAVLGGRWSVRPGHGSAFCATWRAEGSGAPLFLKTLPTPRADVLEAEADGLEALAATATVRVPAVIRCWRDGERGHTVLALEWLELRAPDRGFGARLGRAMAALHHGDPAEGGGRYGWRRDNRLGATPQRNHWSSRVALPGWIEFFGCERLAAMRDRLAAGGAQPTLCDAVDTVINTLPAFFQDGHLPRPSLIHGDLWTGNWGMLADGSPVIYDPAVSCSDAEAELAMMELFGAPPPGFWAAYRETAALHPGYARRRRLYQLYHLLNHALLFGGGYVGQSLELARGLARR